MNKYRYKRNITDISYNPKTEKIFVFSSGTVKAFQSKEGRFQLIENDTDDTSEDEEQDSVTENGVEDSEINDDHGNVASIKEPVDIEQNSQAHSDESKSVIEATDIDTDNNKSEISKCYDKRPVNIFNNPVRNAFI